MSEYGTLLPAIMERMPVQPAGIEEMTAMYSPWACCADWALRKQELRDACEDDTGINLPEPGVYDLVTDNVECLNGDDMEMETLVKFCNWVVEHVWGS